VDLANRAVDDGKALWVLDCLRKASE